MDKKLLAASAALSAFLAAGSAFAGSTNFRDGSLDSCTGINCNAAFFGGTVISFGPTAGAFVGEIYGSAACLRVDIINQVRDLEMVLIAPSGIVYRNDDRAIGDLRPLLKVTNAQEGWYTVQIAMFDGSAQNSDFAIQVGRYTSATNPNCASPSVGFDPVANRVTDDSKAGLEEVAQPPAPGDPGSEF
jgi:hypothetical protein